MVAVCQYFLECFDVRVVQKLIDWFDVVAGRCKRGCDVDYAEDSVLEVLHFCFGLGRTRREKGSAINEHTEGKATINVYQNWFGDSESLEGFYEEGRGVGLFLDSGPLVIAVEVGC